VGKLGHFEETPRFCKPNLANWSESRGNRRKSLATSQNPEESGNSARSSPSAATAGALTLVEYSAPPKFAELAHRFDTDTPNER
jgi:hypothetical protein